MADERHTFPGGFPPAPPGYESRWQRWAGLWRERHGDARASNQVASALENAVTAIGRLSAFEAAGSPNSPGAPTLQMMESARASVDGATQQLARTTALYERLENPAAAQGKSALQQIAQAQQLLDQAQQTLQGALEVHVRVQQACRPLQQAVDAAIERIDQMFNAVPLPAVVASANPLPAIETSVNPLQAAAFDAAVRQAINDATMRLAVAAEPSAPLAAEAEPSAPLAAEAEPSAPLAAEAGAGAPLAAEAGAGELPAVVAGATLQQAFNATTARIEAAASAVQQQALDNFAARVEEAAGIGHPRAAANSPSVRSTFSIKEGLPNIHVDSKQHPRLHIGPAEPIKSTFRVGWDPTINADVYRLQEEAFASLPGFQGITTNLCPRPPIRFKDRRYVKYEHEIGDFFQQEVVETAAKIVKYTDPQAVVYGVAGCATSHADYFVVATEDVDLPVGRGQMTVKQALVIEFKTPYGVQVKPAQRDLSMELAAGETESDREMRLAGIPTIEYGRKTVVSQTCGYLYVIKSGPIPAEAQHCLYRRYAILTDHNRLWIIRADSGSVVNARDIGAAAADITAGAAEPVAAGEPEADTVESAAIGPIIAPAEPVATTSTAATAAGAAEPIASGEAGAVEPVTATSVAASEIRQVSISSPFYLANASPGPAMALAYVLHTMLAEMRQNPEAYAGPFLSATQQRSDIPRGPRRPRAAGGHFATGFGWSQGAAGAPTGGTTSQSGRGAASQSGRGAASRPGRGAASRPGRGATGRQASGPATKRGRLAADAPSAPPASTSRLPPALDILAAKCKAAANVSLLSLCPLSGGTDVGAAETATGSIDWDAATPLMSSSLWSRDGCKWPPLAGTIELGMAIGHGRTSTVYSAKLNGVPVALKCVAPNADKEAFGDLATELVVYQDLRDLQGTLIPRVLGHGVIVMRGHILAAIAMQLVVDELRLVGDIRERAIHNMPLQCRQAALATVKAINGRGICHGDARADNVLFTRTDDGQGLKPILIDFAYGFGDATEGEISDDFASWADILGLDSDDY